jgi:hypothetical protein
VLVCIVKILGACYHSVLVAVVKSWSIWKFLLCGIENPDII